MSSNILYKIQAPVAVRDEFISNDFFIPNTNKGQKVASIWDKSTHGEKYAMLKTAQEEDTDDLAEAYDAHMKRKTETSDEEE